MKIWLDGRVREREEARIPVLDHGLLYGDGIFEGMRMYERRIFQLEAHLRRLQSGAKALHLPLPGGLEGIRRVVLETARAFEDRDAYVRLVITRGDGELGLDPATCPTPRVICMVDRVRIFPEEKLKTGLSLASVSMRRPPADSLDPRVKSLNYLNGVLAKLEARQKGADEALLLNHRGSIAEASVANVFAVHGGRLATPPPSDGALGGITRAAVLGLARELKIEAEERSLGRFDLWDADEAFLTGSGARLVPATSLDGEPIGRGEPGPLTHRLTQAFDALARRTGVAVDEA